VASETTNNTRKTKNKSFAIPAAATAMPVNPKTAAMIATTKNVRAQLSMMFLRECVPEAIIDRKRKWTNPLETVSRHPRSRKQWKAFAVAKARPRTKGIAVWTQSTSGRKVVGTLDENNLWCAFLDIDLIS
jgi:hypothetical protein